MKKIASLGGIPFVSFLVRAVTIHPYDICCCSFFVGRETKQMASEFIFGHKGKANKEHLRCFRPGRSNYTLYVLLS